MRALPPQVRARDQRELPLPPIAVASASQAPYLGPWSCTASPFARSSPIPPVVGWLVDDHRRCDLHVKVVAELPQLLGRSRVLEDGTVDLEGIQFTGPVSIDSFPDASNKRSQLCVVIVATTSRAARRSDLLDTQARLLTIGPTRVIFPAGTRSFAWCPELSHLAATWAQWRLRGSCCGGFREAVRRPRHR